MISTTKKKFLFVVQGEGRGHMTQSIAMQNILLNAGMEVCEILIGKSPQRKIPDFYYEKIKCPITPIDSPNFTTDAKMKAVQMLPSVINNLKKYSLFKASINCIEQKVAEHKPDVIINFYDPLMGLYYLFRKPTVPMVCIAHQYLFNHGSFKFPKGDYFDKVGLMMYTALTAIGAKKKLALSFYPFQDEVKSNTYIIPPLLRPEVFQQQITEGNFILAYLVNSGYMEDIVNWHYDHPSVIIHCFIDKSLHKDAPVKENLYFHPINDKAFLEKMSQCKALVSTAGFESICEAMYLGKPVMMVPVEGHYEQFCNSRDAFLAKAGIYESKFNISKLLEYLNGHEGNTNNYRQWVDQSATKTLEHLLSV